MRLDELDRHDQLKKNLAPIMAKGENGGRFKESMT